MTVVRVMECLPLRFEAKSGRSDNPFVGLFVKALPTDRIQIIPFSWGAALRGGYDVLHLHWPETLVRHDRKLVALLKQTLLKLLLVRVRSSGIALFRTLHNIEPHESLPRAAKKLLQRVDDMTSHWMIMSRSTESAVASGQKHYIPHGHYREAGYVADLPRPTGSLLLFGQIRRYKGAENLARSFAAMDKSKSSDWRLRIAGRPQDRGTAEVLREIASEDASISLDLRFLSEDELKHEILRAEAVVLPYRVLHNSGAALLALSLDRPLILPRSDAAAELSEEFGSNWVIEYEHPLSFDGLQTALSEVRRQVRDKPVDMSAREWTVLGPKIAEALESAARSRRP